MTRTALTLALILVAATGCAARQSTPEEAAKQAFNCAADAARAQVPLVYPLVEDIVNGAEPDWRAEITAKVVEWGETAIACSLGALAGMLTPSGSRALSQDESPGARKAEAYLAEHGWTVTR